MQLKQPQKRKKKAQSLKTAFRSTSKWKRFRKSMGDSCLVDFITNLPLESGWQCHHMDLDPSHYEDLQDRSKFRCLNKTTHNFIHWIWQYYKEDPSIINRLDDLLYEMQKTNG